MSGRTTSPADPTVSDLLVGGRSALLLYDPIRALLGTPDAAATYGRANPDIVERWRTLLAAARSAAVPVLYTRHRFVRSVYPESFLRYLSKGASASLDSLPFVPADGDAAVWDDRILDELAPEPADHVSIKHFNDAVTGTSIPSALRRLGASTLVLSGIATESGIESTARWALVNGFSPVIALDAVSSASPDLHEGSLSYLARAADVVPVDLIAEAWARGS